MNQKIYNDQVWLVSKQHTYELNILNNYVQKRAKGLPSRGLQYELPVRNVNSVTPLLTGFSIVYASTFFRGIKSVGSYFENTKIYDRWCIFKCVEKVKLRKDPKDSRNIKLLPVNLINLARDAARCWCCDAAWLPKSRLTIRIVSTKHFLINFTLTGIFYKTPYKINSPKKYWIYFSDPRILYFFRQQLLYFRYQSTYSYKFLHVKDIWLYTTNGISVRSCKYGTYECCTPLNAKNVLKSGLRRQPVFSS